MRENCFFKRAGSVFSFKIHWDRSYTDFPVVVPPGEYAFLLDTDEHRFGGHNRLTPNQRYLIEHLSYKIRRKTISSEFIFPAERRLYCGGLTGRPFVLF